MIVREAVLDCVRDVDRQFGRLMRGLEEQGITREARIILLSDHSAINHLSTEEFIDTDLMDVMASRGVDTRGVYAFSVSSYGVVYWRGRKKEIARAREVLLAHRAKNPQTGAVECPWWVLDRNGHAERRRGPVPARGALPPVLRGRGPGAAHALARPGGAC